MKVPADVHIQDFHKQSERKCCKSRKQYDRPDSMLKCLFHGGYRKPDSFISQMNAKPPDYTLEVIWYSREEGNPHTS